MLGSLVWLLVMLLGVIFTIPAQAISWDWLGLLVLADFAVAGMTASVSRRASTFSITSRCSGRKVS